MHILLLWKVLTASVTPLVPHSLEPVVSKTLGALAKLVVLERRPGLAIAALLIAAQAALLVVIVRRMVVVVARCPLAFDLVLLLSLLHPIRFHCLKWLLIVIRRF